MSNKLAHLQMLQGIINRLSHNSFLLKGWSVVLVSAMFALAAQGSKIYFMYLAYFPAVAFWGLDGYFLHQERLFRKLYDHVRSINDAEIDFSMNTSIVDGGLNGWWASTFSSTLIAFHGVVVFSIVIVTLSGIFE